MQIVNILCDDRHVELVLKACHQFVTFVGRHAAKLLTALVVELLHQFRVTFVALDACHCLYGILFPEATAVAEGADAALSRHARTGKEY